MSDNYLKNDITLSLIGYGLNRLKNLFNDKVKSPKKSTYLLFKALKTFRIVIKFFNFSKPVWGLINITGALFISWFIYGLYEGDKGSSAMSVILEPDGTLIMSTGITMDQFQTILAQGLLMAPLVSLLVSNQKEIINRYLKVFIDKEGLDCGTDLSVEGTHDNIIKKRIEYLISKAIYGDYIGCEHDKTGQYYVNFLRETLKEGYIASINNGYSHNIVLVVSGTLQMFGFVFLLAQSYYVSLSLLIISLLVIFSKQVLVFRTLAKQKLLEKFILAIEEDLKEADRDNKSKGKEFIKEMNIPSS